jgi:mutator protein MutT
MSHAFTSQLREVLAARVATFPRLAPEHEGLKRAAVVLGLVEADEGPGDAALLLTRRATGLRAHAGQWALPGGRLDEGETPETTALRELHEELGLKVGHEAVLGRLDDYPTRSGYSISPVVVWIADTSTLQPNPSEVASVHRISLAEVGRPESVAFVAIPESERPVIRLRIGSDHIHAPTAALIHQLAELLAGRVTRVAHLEQPVFAWR